MARRLLDTPFFQAENIIGKVYYDDGASTGTGRQIVVEYFKGSNTSEPSPPPSQSTPTQRAFTDGQTILTQFCEGLVGVTVKAQTYFPFAAFFLEQNATLCSAPVVVCDLQATGKVQGLHILLTVTTSHGPWSASIDGVNFSAGRTDFEAGYGESGTITVKDAANCQAKVDYKIADPNNPKPAGELLDVFVYGNDPDTTKIEVYGLRNAPYTVTAWAPSGVPYPTVLTSAQRGRMRDYELPPRCGGVTNTTRIRLFVTLEYPFVRLETSDNSPFCGYTPPQPPTGNFRFDYVLGTNESVAGGDGMIQAAVLGNDGPVLFSLDNYKTRGQANADGKSFTFKDLRAGTYTVWARETRIGGRTIWQRITLSEPPHGMRYQVKWKTRQEVACSANLYLRGYDGPVEQLTGSKNALEIAWGASNATAHFFDQLILGSGATLGITVRAGNNTADLNLDDERQMRLEVVKNDTLVWMGWELPDLYEEPLLPTPLRVTIQATDGLAALKDVPLVDGLGNPLQGLYTHWELLRFLFDRLALPLPWVVLHTLYPVDAIVDATSEPLQLVSTDVAGFADDSGKPWTCEKVLQTLLDYHEMRVQQRDGIWYFERLAELGTGPLTPRRYDAAGVQLPDPAPYTLLRIVYPGIRRSRLYWQNGRQLLSRHPAVAAVSVKAEPGDPHNFLTGVDFPETAFDPTTGNLLAWTGDVQTKREPDPKDVTKPASLRLVQQPNLTEATLDSPEFRLPVAGISLVDANGGPVGYTPFKCTLSFTAKLLPGPYQPAAAAAFTPDPPAGPAALCVGLQAGDAANPSGAGFLGRADVAAGQPSPVKIPIYELTNGSEAKVEIPFEAGYLLYPTAPLTYAVRLRFYGSVVGDIVLSDLRLTIGTATNGSYVKESGGQTKAGPRLTKRDESLTLELADTLNPDERAFSVLDRSAVTPATGAPLSLWREGLDTKQEPYYLIDLLARDRLSWQQKPCWVVAGLLVGDFTAGALVVDPSIDPGIALVATGATWLVAPNSWDITAVQNLTIIPAAPVSGFGLLAEDGETLLLSEDLNYTLVPEDAY
jgi:hypothetical protein